MNISVSLPTAFLAGLVSFLSPCVFPLVPSYVAYVTGMTLDELGAADSRRARRAAVVHSALFVLGFTLVFMTLGATATALGRTLGQWLPWINRIGGVIVVVFGLYLVGWLQLRFLGAERRVRLSSKPAGMGGSVAAGVVFGAGWTPCIGPILATILLLASMEGTAWRGSLLLGVYALGLAIPFIVAAVSVNWFLAGSSRVRRWLGPLQKAAGFVLIAVGILLATGLFTSFSGRLAAMGQLITLEP